MIINYHLKGSNNVGDEHCAPALYFNISDRQDIRSCVTNKDTRFNVAVFGGGAIANTAKNYRKHVKYKAVLWGVGNTSRGVFKEPLHGDYSEFTLAGIRDYNVKGMKNVRWVPCPSCMSTLFDQKIDPTEEYVYYGHKRMSPLGKMNNDNMNFKEVIEYLSSGETVVTSTYHGVYWATLLGKKVICKPFGSKFFGLKHKPLMTNDISINNIKKLKPVQYPDSLEECRNANKNFWREVKCII